MEEDIKWTGQKITTKKYVQKNKMSLELFATLGKFFKAIFVGFGSIFKLVFSKVGLAGILGWRMFIFIMLAIIFIGNSVGTAVKEKDATIVVEDFGSFLFSTDTAIEKETKRVIEEQNTLSIWDWILSFLSIMSNIYMVYFMYWLLFKMFDFFSNQSMPILIKIMWSSLIILCLRMVYITLMISFGKMSFAEDFNNNVFRLVLPYHGIYLFVANITLWTQPLVNLFNKL